MYLGIVCVCMCVCCVGGGVKITVNEISDYAFKKSKGKCIRGPGRGKESENWYIILQNYFTKIVLIYVNSQVYTQRTEKLVWTNNSECKVSSYIIS